MWRSTSSAFHVRRDQTPYYHYCNIQRNPQYQLQYQTQSKSLADMVRTPGVFGGGQSKCTLEIKPDSPFVVFYGSPSEAGQVELSGKLVLDNEESINVRSIRIGLEGKRKIGWITNAVNPQTISQKTKFLEEEVMLFPHDGSVKQAHRIGPGHHEWTFKFTLNGDLPESVEGLLGSYIIYNLTASVDRGYLTKDLSTTKHIRVVRTLGQDMQDAVSLEQINEDIWTNKISYRITVPQKNYIVGTEIKADFILTPLRKGLSFGKVRMEVIEHVQLSVKQGERTLNHAYDAPVTFVENDIPDNCERIIDEVNPNDLFDESYHFGMTLPLPKSLKTCRQSVDTEPVKVQHKLKLYINIHNPEGHVSQLIVKNLLHLFISPNLPVNEDQTVSVDTQVVSEAAMRDESQQSAPPTYGAHQLDRLYDDIDPSGFMTPGPATSGFSTPMWNSRSRRGSNENLQSLNAITEDTIGGASASALRSRLTSLEAAQENGEPQEFSEPRHSSSGGNTPDASSSRGTPVGPGDTYFPNYNQSLPHHSRHGTGRSSNLSRINSDYDMAALVRTPSYNTAVRTPAVATPYSESLPSYDTAVSQPSSPHHGPTIPRSSGRTSPSGQLDTLSEETERNTQTNSAPRARV